MSPLTAIDWVIIGLYAAGIIAVGWYYSRYNRTSEDYLLGARQLRPFSLGLSLFASLLSTLTFLAFPGEMIRYGPMLFTQILALPFIFWVVGWFIIPTIMKLRVTSGYEILEARFGSSVRILGSVYFLIMRLFWMAVILYATTDKVLNPLLDLDRGSALLITTLLAVITIAYTSMGGLRAVVFTDVIHTFVLLFGALLALAFVSFHLGGVQEWWPREWPETWSSPHDWLDPGARVSLFSAVISLFVWFVCTAGSDQIAMQRYLSTRDEAAARSTLKITLIMNLIVTLLLSTLGLALLAYFRVHSHLLREGLLVQADELLTLFIGHAFPPGAKGLVVAGLMAAAMSSLSSGLNSSCSVITADLNLGGNDTKLSESRRLQRARLVSIGVGFAVIALTFLVSLVEGNLLEIAYKLVNLFVAPLFVLFFMAIFVPWATTAGTFAGAIGSLLVAVAIGFFDLGLSFLWIMPGSLVAGAVAGSLLSAALPRPGNP